MTRYFIGEGMRGGFDPAYSAQLVHSAIFIRSLARRLSREITTLWVVRIRPWAPYILRSVDPVSRPMARDKTPISERSLWSQDA